MMNQTPVTTSTPTSLQVQQVNLPKGGGAITGLREVAQTDAQSGDLQFSFPLPDSATLPGPGLQLSGSSVNGNGSFGLGFTVPLPQISIRTVSGVPHYDERDSYQYNGEELVPLAGPSKRYRLRNGADTQWIEKLSTGGWLVVQPNHQQLYFGVAAHTRLADPVDNTHVFCWLLEETVTVQGMHTIYSYKEDTDTAAPFTQRYLKRVRWGNTIGFGEPLALNLAAAPAGLHWLFELVFDYGDQDAASPVPFYNERANWVGVTERADPFSRFNTGFAVRTRFLCRAVRLYAHDAVAGGPAIWPVTALVLAYDENPALTRLNAIELQGYQLLASGWETVAGVPIEFGYQAFTPGLAASFSTFDAMPLAVAGPHQLIDVYGEGVAGVLWQDGGQIWYREPQWDSAHPGSIQYGEAKPLDLVPTHGGAPLRLMDINGDSRLDAVVVEGAYRGFFTLRGKKKSETNEWVSDWAPFVPFSAFPSEFLHPEIHLVDLSGNGLADVVLIGPQSVRLYANTGGSFSPPQTLEVGTTIQLPVTLANGKQLTAFADILGSGTQHLVRITAQEVNYWPNLGHGCFGKKQALKIDKHWAEKTIEFDPDRVLLIDIDGSGAVDLLYIQQNAIDIWLNESGNYLRYSGAIELPVPYDSLSQIQAADIYGNGTSCLIMSRPHMTPAHWVLDLCGQRKPYLMNWIANNRGGRLSARYSSSAQEWLRDKAQSGTKIWSELSFPVPVATQFEWVDEITQTKLTQSFSYSQAYYDSIERMFRGFGKVVQIDTQQTGWEQDEINTAPLRVVSWFHTGNPAIWQSARDDFAGAWTDDVLSAPLHPVILSSQQTYAELSAAERYQAARALRGSLLRQESYGEDQQAVKNIPFTVTEHGYAIRFDGKDDGGDTPRSTIVFASVHVTDTVDYDRPTRVYRHQRTTNVGWDRHGYVSESEAIAFARSGQYDAADPYQDPQQFEQWCTHHTTFYTHQAQDAERWSLGAVMETRTTTQKDKEPAETTAWQRYEYWDPENGNPLPQGLAGTAQLIYQIKTAYLVADQLNTVIAGVELSLDEARELLENGKLITENEYYWQPSSMPTYDTLASFYRVKEIKDPFGNATEYDYQGSPHPSVLKAVTDPVGNCSKVMRYHPGFLTPIELCDPNDNVQEVLLDPFGRVCARSFYGTEVDPEGLSIDTGFAPLIAAQCPKQALDEAMTDPLSVLQGIVSGGSVAQVDLEYLNSWMGCVDATQGLNAQEKAKLEDMLPRLIERGWVDEQKRFRARFTTACELPMPDLSDDERAILKCVWEDSRFPPAMASIVASIYHPTACDVRVMLSYFDSLGRPLMAKAWVEQGEALLHQQLSQKAHSSDRWLTSGKVLYNNKGQPVRQYHPYYINTHRYQADAALNTGERDTLFYDPIGRLIQTRTAAGDWRKTEYHPWFTAAYDENDLLSNPSLQESK